MRPLRTPARRVSLAAGLALAAGTVPVALAQDFTGSVLSARISQSFEADSNYRLDPDSAGTSYFADTRLALGYDNETPTQSFSLGFDTGLRALREARREGGHESEFEVASPSTARVGFSQEWADSAFAATARYRQRRVDFDRLDIDFDDDSGIPDSINRIDGDTTERRYDGSLQLQLATDAPSSYAFRLDATRFDYSDDADNRTPRTTVSGEATWMLELTPVMSSAITGSYLRYEAEDDEDTELSVAEIDAGLNYAVTQYLTVGAGLGYADRRRDETIGGERVRTEDEKGPTFRASVNYAFEDITLVGSLRVSDAAPDTRISGDLRAVYPLPRGRINGRVFQSYTGSTDGDEVRVTGANLNLVRDLTSISSVAFGLRMALQENQDDPTDPDVHRLDATATYTYDFSEVLSADIGYRFRYRDEDDTARSHAVFIEIGRSFETGF